MPAKAGSSDILVRLTRHVIKHLETRYPSQGRNRLLGLFPYGYVGHPPIG
jgi:hypothetical protein